MPKVLTDLSLRISADISDISQNLDTVKNKVGQIGKFTNFQFLKEGFQALFTLQREFIKLLDLQLQAEAKVATAIKSTGGAAGKTTEELKKQASILQSKTLFGDEKILNDVTAQLLSFPNIIGDNFDRAQKSVLDLATLLDGDLKQASLAVGRALQDPTTGLRQLRRAGLALSESQQENIKYFQKTNQLAKAQAIILNQLEIQYGGQAEAQAKVGTGPLRQITNTLRDFAEVITKGSLPALERFALAFRQAVTNLGDALEPTKSIVNENDKYNKTLPPLIDRLGELQSKTKLNADESLELKRITGQIADILPGAVSEWDKYGKAVEISADKAKELLAAQQALVKIRADAEIRKLEKEYKELNEQTARFNATLLEGTKIADIPVTGLLTVTSARQTERVALTADEYAKLALRLEQTSKRGDEVRLALLALTGDTEKYGKAVEAVTALPNEPDADAAQKAKDLADELKKLEKEYQAYYKARYNNDILRAGRDPVLAELFRRRKEYKKFLEEQRIATAVDERFVTETDVKSFLGGVGEQITALAKAAEEANLKGKGDDFETFGERLGRVATATNGVANATANLISVFNDENANFLQKTGALIQTLGQLISLYTALAVAKTAATTNIAAAVVAGGALLATLGSIAFKKKEGRATGGYSQTGSFFAGERGMELIDTRMPTRVYTAPQTKRLMESQESTIVFKIKGDTLLGVLANTNKKNQST